MKTGDKVFIKGKGEAQIDTIFYNHASIITANIFNMENTGVIDLRDLSLVAWGSDAFNKFNKENKKEEGK